MAMRTCYALLLGMTLGACIAHGQAAGPPFAWERATVCFVTTDRFAGLTRDVEAGSFETLGIDAIALSSPFEQVHGRVDAGTFLGGQVLDFTEPDAALGSREDFRRFVDAAHERGLRVLIALTLNHPGPPTPADMEAFGFGAPVGDAGRHPGVPDDTAWARWWGPAWVRANLPGYDPCGTDETTACLHGLPDFKTASGQPVSIPAFLRKKWGTEKLAAEQAALEAFFERTGYPRTPRYHLIKWVTDWVERFGIDGFLVDAANHVEPETWQALRREARRAFRAWQTAHPGRTPGGHDFWMVARLTGDDRPPAAYQGFDAVVTGLSGELLASTARLDSLYAAYAARLYAGDGPHVLTSLSRSDLHRLGRDRLVELGTRLLLLPGAVQRPCDDEIITLEDPTGAVRRAPVGEQVIGAFRRRHPAVAGGTHVKLSDDPYAFLRTFRYGAYEDRVVVVLGASGTTRLNVARAFPDDTVLRDALTGKIGLVSYGLVSFPAHESGVLLLEEVK
ncbi:hypothetical protein GQ464_002505 [Rhodocaloribacter litoris]|uniref:alpha-amylase family glycosyl hydrolase n=1 Tax=Rhodocaloribacter litoris TaxID=2558931 RepID=UPI00141EF952|nr:alpha-amylase family glycosyl hydrolase [Rhodocaloribacter litoris]QXD15840.1 hypothetical protein GQ464_002505 [Rhodocaloribacter litoris]